LGLAWWVEIVTEQPKCIYYFGPFVSANEAQFFQGDYIEDLEQESAQVIAITLKRGHPRHLTIVAQEVQESFESQLSSTISNFDRAWLC
jgi:endonuclease IV